MANVKRATLDDLVKHASSSFNTLLHDPVALEVFLTYPAERRLLQVDLSVGSQGTQPLFMEWVDTTVETKDMQADGFWCPVTDGDSLVHQSMLTRLAHQYPKVLRTERNGFPYAMPKSDPDSVDRYVAQSKSRKTLTVGEKYQQVRLEVEQIGPDTYQRFDEIKRQKYPTFSGCAKFLRYFELDRCEDWYLLSGYLPDGQWLYSCILARGTPNFGLYDTLHVPFFVSNPEAPTTYYAYALAHFACVRHADTRNIDLVNFGVMYPYKEALGFDTTWLPSLRLRDNVLDAYGLRHG